MAGQSRMVLVVLEASKNLLYTSGPRDDEQQGTTCTRTLMQYSPLGVLKTHVSDLGAACWRLLHISLAIAMLELIYLTMLQYTTHYCHDIFCVQSYSYTVLLVIHRSRYIPVYLERKIHTLETETRDICGYIIPRLLNSMVLPLSGLVSGPLQAH